MKTSVLAMEARTPGPQPGPSPVPPPSGTSIDKEKTIPAKIRVHQDGERLQDHLEQNPNAGECWGLMLTAKGQVPDPGIIQRGTRAWIQGFRMAKAKMLNRNEV